MCSDCEEYERIISIMGAKMAVAVKALKYIAEGDGKWAEAEQMAAKEALSEIQSMDLQAIEGLR